MLLRDLQGLLTAVYGTDIGADICDYLVTDAEQLRALERDPGARETAEKLLIEEGDDELGVALYLDAALMQRLADADPRRALCGRNLADFCAALEGVSHFNYLAWNAALDRQVTLLELELQAEIDKYVIARVIIGQQAGSDLAGRLFERLFADPAFDAALQPAERERYRDACCLATRYCRSLEHRFPRPRPAEGMLREIRGFYRLAQPAKISRIRSLALS